jgi:hypothetical protein
MASADEYAGWLVKNEKLKGTPQFSTVAEAYKEAKAEETLGAGQQEGYGESVLYKRPESEQVGVGRKLVQSAGKGITGALDLLVGAPENYRRLAEYATTPNMPVPRPSAPIQTYLTEKGVFKPEAEFSSPIGRVADFTTQMYTGGGFNPARSAKSLLNKPLSEAGRDIAQQFAMTGTQGIVGGGTSETLRQAGIDSPVAQFIATGGATSVAGAPYAMRSTTADIANKGLRNVTPDQLRMADLLMKDSARMGSPITGAEAIAQVTGNKSLLGTQRFVENAQASQPTMNEFMTARPAGQRQAFEATTQNIGPAPTSATPINMQAAAENLIGGARESLTRNNDLLYKQAGRVNVYPAPAVFENPRIAEAVSEVTKTAKYGVKGGNPNSFETLIAAKKYLDDEYSTQMSGATGLQVGASAITAKAADQLSSYLKENSPQYKRGAGNYETALGQQINPIQAGPVGQIAGGADAAQVLMPSKPVSLYPADIKRTVELLRRKDPEAVPSFVRQQLEANFNEASQNLQGGPNQMGGPKFVANIAGNKQQRDNLRTLITESSGMQAYQGFEKFMDTMEAQGQRLPANSATTFNEMARQEMGGGILSKVATPLQPSRVAKFFEEYQMGNNSKKLAEMLVDPNSVNKLEELARTGPKSLKRQAIVNSLLGGYTATKPEIKEEELK